jgi:hypothetical protein
LERIKQKVLLKIIDLLNIDIDTLSGLYSNDDLIKLEDFILNGTIELDNTVIKVQSLSKGIFEFKNSTYENKVALSTDILKNTFGLKHTKSRPRVDGKRVNQFEICSESIENMEILYQLAFQMPCIT